MAELIVKRPSTRKRKRSRRGFVRAKMCRFCADSTLLLDYKDANRARTDFSLSCRIYRGGGVPPRELLVAALEEAS